jgi:hypothetical protein
VDSNKAMTGTMNDTAEKAFEDEHDPYNSEGSCPECCDGEEPDLWQSACIDDLCHGGEVPCMHGDWARLKCGLCGK